MSEPKGKVLSYRDIGYVVLFTLLVQYSALLLAGRFIVTYTSLPSFEPAGQGVEGSVINSIILVVVAFGASMMMILLIRLGREKILRLILGTTIGFGTVTVTFTLTTFALSGIIPFSGLISLGASLVLGALAVLSLFKSDARRIQTLSSLSLAIYYGTALAVFMKPPTVLVLPLAFGLYDLYAVFRGPLKILIEEAAGKVNFYPMIVSIGEVHIGLGDLVFYSMLPAVGLLLLDLPTAIMLTAVVQGGLVGTLFLLRKFAFLPGLPIPLFLGTGFLALALYL